MHAFNTPSQKNFIIDGEIVAFRDGVSNFSALQKRLGVREISLESALKVPVQYYIFDILFLNGYDLRKLPLRSRKRALQQLISYHGLLHFTEWILEDGINFYKKSCRIGWEGIIAKNFESTYYGRRSTDWLKFKCHKSQELVIIGYTAPKGHRYGFGALLVGYYKKKKLLYAGKVGTGFDEKTLISLKKKMDKHRTSSSPIDDPINPQWKTTWVKPILVGEFDFTEWTSAGKLRHPRFKGLRDDKNARDVVREDSL